MLITQVAILLQSFIDDAFEFNGNFRIQAHRGGRRLVQDRVKNVARTFSAERHRARYHLIENRAEREEIGARVQLLAAHLLRRHVSHRAQRGSRTGQVLFARQRFLNGRGRAV